MKKETLEKIDATIEKICDGIILKVDKYGPQHVETVTEPTKALAEVMSARALLMED